MVYTKYWQMESKINTLYNQNKYQEALNILEKASESLPSDEFEKYKFNIMLLRADFCCDEKRYQECLDIMEYLINQGYACDNDIFEILPDKDDIRYMKLKNKNDIYLAEAKEKAKFKYVVHIPEDYSQERQYPLFLALHGDPGNIDEFSEYWKPDELLKNGFIVVYVQSSQLLIHDGYGWTENFLVSRKDIKECYNLVSQKYSVDDKRVIIGGFSGGAMAALDIAMANIIPVKGIIALGPDLTEAFTKENAKMAAERGVKCVLMEGEVLIPSPELNEMIKIFKEVGFSYKLYINKGIGHAVPEDLSYKLNQAIEFIYN